MSKLKLVLSAAILLGIFSVTSCTKKTTNTTIVQDSIYYSAWTPLNMTRQIDTTTKDTFYMQTISAHTITSSIISHGAVLGYYGFLQSAGDTSIFNEAELSSIAAVTVNVGSIVIEAAQNISYSNGGYLFRYVVIPGNVLTTSFNGMTQQQLNKMSFTDLQKTIGSWQQTSGRSFNP